VPGLWQKFTKDRENLSQHKIPKQQEAWVYNEPLSKANDLKVNTRQSATIPTKKSAHGYLQVWLVKAYATDILPLKLFANTITDALRQILSCFEKPICNAIMEGISNKIRRPRAWPAATAT
jgi:transposase